MLLIWDASCDTVVLASERVHALPGDAAEAGVPEALITKAEQRFGRRPSIFTVNAGRGLPGTLLTSDAACWEEFIRVRHGFQNAVRRLTMTKMAAAVRRARTIRPILSCRRSRRLLASNQAQPCSTMHRTLPSPDPCGSPILRM